MSLEINDNTSDLNYVTAMADVLRFHGVHHWVNGRVLLGTYYCHLKFVDGHATAFGFEGSDTLLVARCDPTRFRVNPAGWVHPWIIDERTVKDGIFRKFVDGTKLGFAGMIDPITRH